MYGDSQIGTVQSPDKTKTYKVYFPKRYGGVFSDVELEYLKQNAFWLVPRGQRGKSIQLEIVQ